MPVTLLLDVEIQANDGKQRKQTTTVSLPNNVKPDRAFEWLLFVLNCEAEVESMWANNLGPLPDPSAISGKLPKKINLDLTADTERYFDISNTRTAWYAVCNLLRNARIQLARSSAYKAVETQLNTKVDDFRLQELHYRKMGELHHAVRNIKKIEDVVLRLVFEAVGGQLDGIDTSKDEWERELRLDDNFKEKLRRDDRPLGKRLKTAWKLTKKSCKEIWRCIRGARIVNQFLLSMPENEYQQFRQILDGMSHKSSPEMRAFWDYRHRLEHRMPKSVDYVEFYLNHEDRPQTVEDPSGAKRTVANIGQQLVNPHWKYDDLLRTTTKVYNQYLRLVQQLSSLSTFLK